MNDTTARNNAITAAKAKVARLPRHQRAALENEFNRAEAEAAAIVACQGPTQ